MRFSSHKLFARAANYRSILASVAPNASTQTPRHASLCATAPPLASRWHARGRLAAQIPIAERAARPTAPSRDFVPWRFSDAGHRSAWLAHRCRRPKTCTKPDPCSAAKKHPYSITSSASASSFAGNSSPSAFAALRLSTNRNCVGRCTGRSAGFAPLKICPV